MKSKRLRGLSLLLITQLLISIVILYLDLGATHLGIYFSLAIDGIIPSILPTAAITQTPESSALILAFSWVMSFAFVVGMISRKDLKYAKYFANRGERYIDRDEWQLDDRAPTWVGFVCLFVLLSAVFILPFKWYVNTESTAQDISRSIRPSLVYLFLKDFKPFIILYGAGISLLFSIGIYLSFFIAVSLYFRTSKDDKTKPNKKN